MTFDRTPPFSAEAETTVLGALFISKDAMTSVRPIIRDGDFYREANRRIYRACDTLWNDGDVIDVITVGDKLKASGELEAAGGFAYLAGLIDAVPTAENVEYHARIVRDKAILRRIIEAASETIRAAYNGDGPGPVLAEAEKLFTQIESIGGSDFRVMKDTIWETFEWIEKMQDGSEHGLRSGYSKLDRMTSGFQRGDLVVIAGRPSMGKTALLMNMLVHMSVSDDEHVGVVSLEMGRKALTFRALCSEARVDMQQVRHGTLSPEGHQRLATAAGHLNTAPLFIDDHPVTRLAELRAKIKRLVHRHGVKLVAIDYLQLLEGAGEESRRHEVEAITRGLKLMALELDITVVALSQLSRALEQRSNKRPMLSDLRETGSIEQDADVVMFVYRPEVYVPLDKKFDAKREGLEGVAELIIGKQRNGPIGSVPLYFNKAYTRFDTLEGSR